MQNNIHSRFPVFFHRTEHYISSLSRALTLLIKLHPRFCSRKIDLSFFLVPKNNIIRRQKSISSRILLLLLVFCLECGWKFIWCSYLYLDENSARRKAKRPLIWGTFHPHSHFYHFANCCANAFREMCFDIKWKWNSFCPKVFSSSCWWNVNPISNRKS